MHIKIFIILIATASIVSCGKDKTTPTPLVNVPKVKTETNLTSGLSYNYTYDSQGRVIKVTKPSTNYEEYVYTPTLATFAEYSAAGVLQYRKYYELNSQGLAIKLTYDDPIYLTTYTYNSDKQPLKTTNYQNGVITGTTDYYYTNKLLDSAVNKSPNNLNSTTYAYEYYDNIENTFSEKNFGRLNWGELSSKAIKKFSLKDYIAGVFYPNTYYTISYVYELDAQN